MKRSPPIDTRANSCYFRTSGRYIGAVDRERCSVPDAVPLLQIGHRLA